MNILLLVFLELVLETAQYIYIYFVNFDSTLPAVSLCVIVGSTDTDTYMVTRQNLKCSYVIK